MTLHGFASRARHQQSFAQETVLVQMQEGSRPHLQVFGHFADSLESVIGTQVSALVRVDEQGQPPVPLLDLAWCCCRLHTQYLICICFLAAGHHTQQPAPRNSEQRTAMMYAHLSEHDQFMHQASSFCSAEGKCLSWMMHANRPAAGKHCTAAAEAGR